MNSVENPGSRTDRRSAEGAPSKPCLRGTFGCGTNYPQRAPRLRRDFGRIANAETRACHSPASARSSSSCDRLTSGICESLSRISGLVSPEGSKFFGSTVSTQATRRSRVQFFLTMTCQSKRCVMMSLIRISRAIHNRQQSQGRATFCSTQFPQTPSVPSVRRSRSSNCLTV